MAYDDTAYYEIPAFILDYLVEQGYPNPYGVMKQYIFHWNDLLRAYGEFWDYKEIDNGIEYQIHRRSVKPARRVSDEWASLILNDETVVATDNEEATDWLADYYERTGFKAKGQELVSDAFGMGTAAWALWVDMSKPELKVRRYDARMILPLTWDDDDVTECAFATQVTIEGRTYNQLQMHILEGWTYHIVTRIFDDDGKPVSFDGIEEDFDTKGVYPPFAVIRPALQNRYVDFSPYGQAVFAEHEDVLLSVDLAYDAVFNEVDLAKMRVFMSDMLFEVEGRNDGSRKVIPFGKRDATIYRKIASTDDIIKEYAPSMRTDSQREAYRLAVQTMGDQCGFGSHYFDIDKTGGLKTATEVAADNSMLFRTIRRHENLIGFAIAQLSKAVLHFARTFLGESIPDEGNVRVDFDDSIINDTFQEQQQDLAEVAAGVMAPYQYRMKWYGECEEEAIANVPSPMTEQFVPMG